MSKINIFYHVWQGEGWQILFQQQILSLVHSGLYDACDNVYVCINGNEPLGFELSKFIVLRNNIHINESDTLKQLWKLCNVVDNSKVFYFHTKGLAYQNHYERPNADAWRHYLEYFNIFKWKECIKKLSEYDAVGTEWNNKPCLYIGFEKRVLATKNSGIFVGNFWWANSNYIKTLDVNYLYQYNAPHVVENWPLKELETLSERDKQQILRHNSELWLGSNNPKVYSFRKFDLPFYSTNVLNRLEEFE